MTIESVKVRASMSGSGFNVETPYIISFYIRKSRNELSSFSFSVKVKQGSVSGSTGGQVSFWVNNERIYTGIILSMNVRPCFDDPSYCIIDGNGTDIRKELEYKQYTRRCTDSISSWALITGIVRKGLKSQKLIQRPRISLGGAFYTSPDQFQKGDAQSTSMVKDYLNQSSGGTKSNGNRFGELQPYGYVISPSEE